MKKRKKNSREAHRSSIREETARIVANFVPFLSLLLYYQLLFFAHNQFCLRDFSGSLPGALRASFVVDFSKLMR